jgi:hypothetical protein
MPPTPRKGTPLRRSTRVSSPAEDSIVIDTTPQASTQAIESTTPSRTPETRKRRIDFHSLHNYGFQGPELSTPKPSKPTTPPAKRARLSTAEKSQASIKESQSQAIIDDIQSEEEDINKEKKRNGAGKRAWWWKFYTISTLSTTYKKGRGKRTTEALDEKYTCTLCKAFHRKASNLGGSTTGLSDHIIEDYKRYENEGEAIGSNGIKQTGLQRFLKEKEAKSPEFEEAMVDWIIDTCQPYTITETTKFRVMIKAAGYTGKIVKGDTIAERVQDKFEASEKDLISLLDRTCTTLAISFDGWTSTNNLSMFAMNGKWAGPDMKIYQACLDFIEIKGNHSGKNLAKLVFNRGKKLNILYKIISLTGDNASNNDTCARHLHKMMEYLYDDHLDPMPVHYQSMRFKGDASLIDCLAHVDNLIVKAILKSLGSSTFKDAVEFLDRVKERGWKDITMPMASGDIAVLRIVVLWINRSPQRIQEWLSQQGVTKMIPYDVDTRWNYTLVMLEAALQNRAALQAWVKDHPELQHLKFDKERWKRLNQIRDLLKPFEQHTLHVSREEPTLHRIPNLYLKLDQILQSIIKKQGVYASYDPSLIEAARKGLEIFNKYYLAMKSNDMYWIACVLDPRIKTNWLKKNHPDAQEILVRIKKFMKEAYLPEEQLPERLASDNQQAKMDLEFDFLQEYGSTITAEDDIDRYFDTPSVKFVLNEKECQVQWILNWWAAHKQEFPLMFAVARDYLPIPGAEVDVERLFNIARNILGLRRMSMSAETLRALILLKDYLRRLEVSQV